MEPSESSLWSLLGLAFVLGLTHGADPDHLTAIDGMTRATVERHPRMSRWIGTWFAVGHSLTVLSIAALIAFAAGHLGSWNALLQQTGGLLSALLLFVIGTINVMKLVEFSSGEAAHERRTAIHPLCLQSVKIAHPLSAIPIGALFGMGFETASQMAAWGLAGTVGLGHSGAILVGIVFCLGMVMTDSVNGLLVRRLYVTAAMRAQRSGRVITVTVIGLAYGIGVIKLLQPTTFAVSVTDAELTVLVVGSLLLVFVTSIIGVNRQISS